MKVEVSVELAFPATEVWKLAGGYNLLPIISTNTTSSILEDGGRMRVLANRDGSILWERLLDFNEAEMTLSYEITDAKAFSGAYGAGYRGRLTIREAGADKSVFHYVAEFEPAPGFTEEAAKAAVEAFSSDCAAGIARALGAGTLG